jgi:Glycine zipper 2TM domain
MTKSSTFAKGCVAATAGLLALGVAAAASAQPAPGYNNYDPCQRDANGRGVAGAVIGGAGGAVIGSQLAAGGHRTDGSLLGGVVGAIAGAAIGHNTAACNNGPPPPPGEAADAGPPPPPPGYQPGPPPPSPPGYGGAYYAAPPPGYERPAIWVYGRHGVRYRVVEDRIGPDGCSMAEGPPVYDAYGRPAPSWVRVCPDYRGRFRIVY